MAALRSGLLRNAAFVGAVVPLSTSVASIGGVGTSKSASPELLPYQIWEQETADNLGPFLTKKLVPYQIWEQETAANLGSFIPQSRPALFQRICVSKMLDLGGSAAGGGAYSVLTDGNCFRLYSIVPVPQDAPLGCGGDVGGSGAGAGASASASASAAGDVLCLNLDGLVVKMQGGGFGCSLGAVVCGRSECGAQGLGGGKTEDRKIDQVLGTLEELRVRLINDPMMAKVTQMLEELTGFVAKNAEAPADVTAIDGPGMESSKKACSTKLSCRLYHYGKVSYEQLMELASKFDKYYGYGRKYYPVVVCLFVYHTMGLSWSELFDLMQLRHEQNSAKYKDEVFVYRKTKEDAAKAEAAKKKAAAEAVAAKNAAAAAEAAKNEDAGKGWLDWFFGK